MSNVDPKSNPQGLGNRPGGNGPENKPTPSHWRSLIWYLPMLLLLLWIWQDMIHNMAVTEIGYSEFKDYLARGQVESCRIHEAEVTGVIDPHTGTPGESKSDENQAAKEGKKAEAKGGGQAPAEKGPGSAKSPPVESPPKRPEERFSFRTDLPPVGDPKLIEELEARGVRYDGVRPDILSSFLIAWIPPIAFILLLWFFLSRRLASAGQAVMSIGRSRARLSVDQKTGVTFADVAGCDEAKYELQEVVDFLKNPNRYEALGAKIPKGILLVGPPGTGKTLMARAVAGEAQVSFFSLSGSDFVEMFVGVGAARVRDLFEQAKRQSPCIVFIDELDAIGRQRSVHVGVSNDEREQTLNQLLVEMDGFEPNLGVIILAATNRPDVLDRALLRPGRFDRQVVVDAPDAGGREAILKVHARNKPLAPDVNLRSVAKATMGFSGADLANALNEAALLAARRGANQITQRDLEEAVEKIVAGPERTSRRLQQEERRRVAYHEVGHALVAAYSRYADPVHKISVVPRGRAALGYTLQLPTVEQFLMTRSALVDRLKGLLGGRAAEQVAFNEVSTGAENDLERATALARQMVAAFGMSDSVGLVHCANRQSEFLPPGVGQPGPRDCSEQTSREIDEEVKKLLDEAYRQAIEILGEHRDQLDLVSAELLQHESLDAAAFHRLIGRPLPEESADRGARPVSRNGAEPGAAEGTEVLRKAESSSQE